MTSAGTPFGEPRRDALAEVERLRDIIAGTLNTEGMDVPRFVCRYVAEDVLQHLASQRQEQGEGWRQIAEQESRNRDYYRSLVVEIGELFGVAARTADDGGISEDVLCAKVPELVRAQAAAQGDLKADHETLMDAFERERAESESRRATLLEVRAQQREDWVRAENAEALVARLGESLKHIRLIISPHIVGREECERIDAILAEIAPTTPTP